MFANSVDSRLEHITCDFPRIGSAKDIARCSRVYRAMCDTHAHTSRATIETRYGYTRCDTETERRGGRGRNEETRRRRRREKAGTRSCIFLARKIAATERKYRLHRCVSTAPVAIESHNSHALFPIDAPLLGIVRVSRVYQGHLRRLFRRKR